MRHPHPKHTHIKGCTSNKKRGSCLNQTVQGHLTHLSIDWLGPTCEQSPGIPDAQSTAITHSFAAHSTAWLTRDLKTNTPRIQRPKIDKNVAVKTGTWGPKDGKITKHAPGRSFCDHSGCLSDHYTA